MINCYKILEVPDFSDTDTIHKGYRRMAKRYHPDVSRHVNAEENFKRISKAYSMLSDPITKQYHDQILRQGSVTRYTRQTTFTPHSSRSGIRTEEDFKRRKAWVMRQRLKHDLSFYIKENETFSYNLRLVGWAVGSLLGWQIVFTRWFVNEDSYDHIIAFGGFLAFLLCCFGLLSVLYKKFRLEHYTKKRRIDYGKWSFRITTGYLAIAVLALPFLSQVREDYHLDNFSQITLAKIEHVMARDIEVSFTPINSNEKVVKRRRLKPNVKFESGGNWVWIRYSYKEPRIMELVYETD